MKKYAITINAVFDSIEELETAIADILDMSKRFGIDNYPNCLNSNYDFDLIKCQNEDVVDYINKRRLSYLLHDTEIVQECNGDYKLIFERLNEYVGKDDVNRYQIESLLKDLI
jgi:hypothetical protein